MSNRYWRQNKTQKKRQPKRSRIQTFDEANLQLKKGIWHAVMPIPRDVQEAIGTTSNRKLRFSASLRTKHLSEAEMRLPAHINQWKAKITEARRAASRNAAATSNDTELYSRTFDRT